MKATMVDATVTYTIDHQGQLFVVENVPARVCVETGEPFFAPATVERLRELIASGAPPERVIETPVYEFH